MTSWANPGSEMVTVNSNNREGKLEKNDSELGHYNFYKKYIPEFTEECKVVFKGFDDGSFELKILFKNDNVTDYESILVFDNAESINNFIGLLNGKAVKNEINDIFK